MLHRCAATEGRQRVIEMDWGLEPINTLIGTGVGLLVGIMIGIFLTALFGAGREKDE